MSDTALVSELAAARRPIAATVKILLNWACIFAVFVVVGHHPTMPALVVGVLLVGIEQHALGLWMHEGIHWLIAKNKLLNDVIVTMLLSGPLFVPLRAFRPRHFIHHGYLGTPRDTKPVIFTRLDGRQFWSFLLRSCFGLQLFSIVKVYLSPATPARASEHPPAGQWIVDVLGIAVAQGLLLWLVSRVAPWHVYLWLWVLPWLTINRFVAGVRSVIEHQPIPPERHPFTRALRPTLLDRLLFCRVGFQYHWTHHRYPNVPCFNLPLLDTHADQPVGMRRGYLETLVMIVRSSPEIAEDAVHVG